MHTEIPPDFQNLLMVFRVEPFVQTSCLRCMKACPAAFCPLRRFEGLTCFPLLVPGAAGLRQLRPRGRGAVEGHHGSPGESGGGVAQGEPFLNILPRRTTDVPLSCCRSGCTSADHSRARRASQRSQNRTMNCWRCSGSPGRHSRCSVTSCKWGRGWVEQSVDCEK